MKIQAAVLRGGDKPYSLERLELAGPSTGEILVRIAGTGTCHTDMVPRAPAFAELAPLPLGAGDGGAGGVEAIGPGVTGIAVGDHVALSFDSCGMCTGCRSGHPAYCETFLPRNLSGRHLSGDRRSRKAGRGALVWSVVLCDLRAGDAAQRRGRRSLAAARAARPARLRHPDGRRLGAGCHG